jgi:hypothetical protein
VLATRFGIEVLRTCGVEAHPFPCSFGVYNAEAAQLQLTETPIDQWPESAWSLGVAAIEHPEGQAWSAHLCIEWLGKSPATGLLDLDLTRYSRPEHGISMRPLVARWPEGQKDTLAGTFDGSMVHWVGARHLRGYRKGTAWTQLPHLADVARMVSAVTELTPGLA